MTISPEQVREVRAALWQGWIRMAKELPNHHILSVELLRTHNNETAAVITAVKDHVPVRYVVRGDASGRLKPNATEHCDPHDKHGHGEHGHGDPNPRSAAAPVMAAPVMAATVMAAPLSGSDGGLTPEGMALGEPPPQQDPRPGIIALGGSLLSVAFGVGEQVPA